MKIPSAPNYLRILISQILLMFFAPFMEKDILIYIMFASLLLLTFLSVIQRIKDSKTPLVLAIVSGAIAIISSFVWAIPNATEHTIFIGFTICTAGYAFFILIAIVSISKTVFITDKVTSDRIIGSICVYMLIGMFFAFVYATMNFDGKTGFEVERLYDYIYFSFASLTTTGYGDIVPTNGLAKMVASIEGVVGSMYVAVVVARLVGMHIASKFPKEPCR